MPHIFLLCKGWMDHFISTCGQYDGDMLSYLSMPSRMAKHHADTRDAVRCRLVITFGIIFYTRSGELHSEC